MFLTISDDIESINDNLDLLGIIPGSVKAVIHKVIIFISSPMSPKENEKGKSKIGSIAVK
jgi:hypothetical protein